MKKTQKKRRELSAHPTALFSGRNPKLNAQTRKVLRAHYAEKYRTR